MLSHQLNEEPCPVSESLLGDMYRANPEGLAKLIETVPPYVRALLAMYCRRRAHLSGMALAVAASCDKDALIIAGGDAGALLYEQARHAPGSAAPAAKVSVARAPFMKLVAQDLI